MWCGAYGTVVGSSPFVAITIFVGITGIGSSMASHSPASVPVRSAVPVYAPAKYCAGAQLPSCCAVRPSPWRSTFEGPNPVYPGAVSMDE